MARALLLLQILRVSGHSMTPTLLDGDVLLVWHGGRVRPGHIVLARFRSMPGRPVVKRAVRPSEDGWLLASDNARAGSDSERLGVADVQARALVHWRLGPGRSRGASVYRLLPRRVEVRLPDDL